MKRIGLGFLILFLLAAIPAVAQDLEPRALARAPVGMNFFVLAYGYSSGNVMIDQSLPLEGTEAKLHSLSLAFAKTFGLFGRTTKFDMVVPFSHGTWEGLLSGARESQKRIGFADPLVRFTVNLLGAPALSGEQFLGSRAKFQLAGSLKIRVPLGQYDQTKLVNLSTHRWQLRPSLGGSVQLRKWTIETHLNLWLFTTNSNLFNGNTLSQKPLLAAQLHSIHEFRPGLWAAVSFGRSGGGETTLNDIERDDSQQNSRFGAALSLPVSNVHSLKLFFTSGVTTRYGADFDTFGLAYQYRWGG